MNITLVDNEILSLTTNRGRDIESHTQPRNGDLGYYNKSANYKLPLIGCGYCMYTFVELNEEPGDYVYGGGRS